MAKKFKRVIYEKEDDDHYVVVINPWANGTERPRMKAQIDFIGAWLRIAFRKPAETNIIKTIFTLDTRDEVIVRISSEIDVEIGLGAHLWREFMGQEHIDKIKRQTNGRVDVSDQISFIFIYNWALHGDPAEHQWKEWFPRQDGIPPDIMIKMDYPEPRWTEVPPADARLRNLLLPIPPRPELLRNPVLTLTPGSRSLSLNTNSVSSRGNSEAQETKPAVEELRQQHGEDRASESTTAYTPYRPPVHLHSQSLQPQPRDQNEDIKPRIKGGKLDKLDPYEEEEVARASLTPPVVKVEAPKVKAEVEDVKPNVRSTDYQPSDALLEAVLKVGGASVGHGEQRSAVKKEDTVTAKSEHTPSSVLLDAYNRYSAASTNNKDEKRKAKRVFEGNHNSEETGTLKAPSMKRVKTEAEANF